MDLSQFMKDGKFLMLALDHRGSFKKLMGEDVSDQEMISLKREIIDALKAQMSGLLIDVDLGLPAFDRSKSFLLPAEKSGYGDAQGERVTQLEYTAAQLKEMGASGVKLLLYFNPFFESFKHQLMIGKEVREQCQRESLPFFLELVTYDHDEGLLKAHREKYISDSLKVFINSGIIPDVWKLEYPGSLAGCEQITQLVGDTPWILLTRGDSFEVFVPELEEAVKAGCSGFLAGRALWQEVCTLKGEEKDKFLQETLPNRFKQIAEVVLRSGRV